MTKYVDINSQSPLDKKNMYGEDEVMECVRKLTKTFFGDKFFRPEVNFIAKELLFELDTYDAAFYFVSRIIDFFDRWEPRVEFNANKTEIKLNRDKGKVFIHLSCIIIETSNEFEVDFSM